MNKLIILLQQYFIQKLKSKSFIITSSIYLIVMLIVAFFGDIKDLFNGDEEPDVVAIYNATSSKTINAFGLGDDYTIEMMHSEEAINTALEQEKAIAGFIFSEDQQQLFVKIYSLEPLPLAAQTDFNDALVATTTNYAFEQIQLSESEQAYIQTAIPMIEMIPLNDESSKSAEEKQAGMIGSYAVGILIYFFVIGYLSIITTDVASEKGSRALEMILVSVKPESHFQAKVFGTLFVALTQFILLIVVGLALFKWKASETVRNEVSSLLSELNASYIVFIVLFLLLTLLLYLIIGALFGSLVSKVEESSQVMAPAMIIVVAAFYIMMMAFNNPDSILVKVFSYVPFTSGMVMPMRLGGADLHVVEPILSLTVLLLTVFALYKFSIVYYKRSVLTYSSGGIFTKIKQMFKMSN